MESLIATDGWLKDYDPLFDLFDEEMRLSKGAGSSQTATISSLANTDYFNDYDLNANNNNNYSSYYNNPYYYKQTDELSLILGLEWLPCNELNSPSTSTSSSSSSVSSTSSPSTSPPSPQHQQATKQTPTVTHSTSSNKILSPIKTTSSSSASSNNNHHHHHTLIQKQRVFKIQLQNHNNDNITKSFHQQPLAHSNEINQPNSAHSITASASPQSTSTKTQHKACILVNNNSNHHLSSNLIDNSITHAAGSNLKRKKKCLKTRGTSLLAQPSHKLNNLPSSSPPKSTTTPTASTPSQTKSALTPQPLTINNHRTTTSTLPTLITINRPSNIVSPSQPIKQQQHLQQQMLPKTTMLLSTTTIINNNNNSNQTIPLSFNAGKANNTSIGNNSSKNSSCNLTKLDRSIRCCIQIEHAYSSMCS